MNRMQKIFWGGVLTLVLVMGAVPVRADAAVNDFTITSFSADYYLSQDANKRSELQITEQIVAVFPEYNQNHGIERAIPQAFNGHGTRLELASVADANGEQRSYTTYESNDNTVVRIGDADTYVHGSQTYVLKYAVHDVTRTFDQYDELFWDVNGTGWSQPFGSVTARLHIGGELRQAFNKQIKCYQGSFGSQASCGITTEHKAAETVLTFTSTRALGAGENISFVAGFERGSFVPYQKTFWERWWPIIAAAWFISGGIVLIVMIIVLVRLWRTYGKAPAGKGTIVPQYLPPKEVSVLMAAHIVRKSASGSTAQLIDLAVRHYLKIYETEAKASFFRTKRSYAIELIKDPSTLRPEEVQLLRMFFGKRLTLGSKVSLDNLKSSLYAKAAQLEKRIKRQAQEQAIFEDRAVQRKKYFWIGGILLILGILLLNPGVCIAGLVTLIVAAQLRPLTATGVATREYLDGLKMYMQLAEADRLRLMQSPEGAARMYDSTAHDTHKLVKIYERLLPYAIIFGIEKEWLKAFAPLYEQPPDWYAGNWTAFNAGVFASSLGDFTAASNTTFAPADSSSSSGFSGGGSGGGGGGGGGGGW